MSNNTQVNLRLSSELNQLLNELARKTGKSKNQLILDAICSAYQGGSKGLNGDIIASTISSSIVSSHVVSDNHHNRISCLESQMKQVLDRLGLDSLTNVTEVSETIAQEETRTQPKRPVGDELLTTEELVEQFCIEDDAMQTIQDNMQTFCAGGLEDDYGNNWYWVHNAQRWTPNRQSLPEVTRTDTELNSADDTTVAIDDTITIQTAKELYREYTGLEPTVVNAKKTIKAFYLGGTLTFKKERDWVTMMQRLENVAGHFAKPLEPTYEESDLLFRKY